MTGATVLEGLWQEKQHALSVRGWLSIENSNFLGLTSLTGFLHFGDVYCNDVLYTSHQRYPIIQPSRF